MAVAAGPAGACHCARGGAGTCHAAVMPSAAGPPLVVSAAGAVMSRAVGAAPVAEGPLAVPAVNTLVPVPSHRWGLQGAQAVHAMPAMQGVQASPNQGLEYVFPLEREPAGGGGGAAPPAQAVPASEPEHFALEEALHRIQLAHTDMEVFKVVNSLAVALGARRTEMGTVKALHAVLLQLVRPGISNAEACNATGASTSNFSKWRRQVQKVQLDHHLYLTSNQPPVPAHAAAAPGLAPSPARGSPA